MRRPDACSVEGGRTGHRMVRVIAWSESLHGPSHRLVRVIAWSMVRVIAWSESLHGPSHRMVRVLACSESSSASITRRDRLRATEARRPLESSPPASARARVHAHHLGGRPQGSGSRTTGTPPEWGTPNPGQVGPDSPPARGRLRADRPNAPPTTKEALGRSRLCGRKSRLCGGRLATGAPARCSEPSPFNSSSPPSDHSPDSRMYATRSAPVSESSGLRKLSVVPPGERGARGPWAGAQGPWAGPPGGDSSRTRTRKNRGIPTLLSVFDRPERDGGASVPPMPVHEFSCCVCDGANRPKGRPEARAGPGPGTGCGGTCAGLGFACGRR